ncbi:carboxymuconolactone decarboxylase family protein [Saxibacter everestensis]|uniref:Carboxymuconolactone decarboxylase family protein n=1 Tax=Saxibacter everestensis TaxID=2909229 RepID=A0ABY8QS79_9MICO|nr:carboxymuconolactone decarboxylase family protein [Brevibacteriaceae bacterium ZFBP1038]
MIVTELTVGRWRSLTPTQTALATMVSAGDIGCSWCMDFGVWEHLNQGVDPVKLREVPNWRESAVYTDAERRVMEYASAMTQSPPTVTDEMVSRLQAELSEAQVVELTALIALENQRSRFNFAMGLTSQGFKASCDLADR